MVRITLEQSDTELEEDWRTQDNKYGLIKGNVGTPLIEEKK